MKQFFHNNRYRILRERITKLSELPEEKQNIFKNIKKTIENYYNREVDVYFFGSHKNGYWDELSDYDLMLPIELKDSNLKDYIEKTLEIKVDLTFTFGFKNGILI